MNDDKIAALIADLDHADKRRIRAAVDALIPLAAAAPALADELNQLLDDSRGKHRWPAAKDGEDAPG